MTVDASTTIPGDLAALVDLRSWAVTLAARAGVGARQIGDLELALTEAVSNVIRHGHGGGSPQPVELRLRIDEHVVELHIADRGVFWDGAGANGPQEGGAGGYGVDLIARIMDRVERRPRPGGGTELRLVMERSS